MNDERSDKLFLIALLIMVLSMIAFAGYGIWTTKVELASRTNTYHRTAIVVDVYNHLSYSERHGKRSEQFTPIKIKEGSEYTEFAFEGKPTVGNLLFKDCWTDAKGLSWCKSEWSYTFEYQNLSEDN
ncbi:hypothetical protein [Yersinia phage fHe-Yen9-03]|uniref:Uncharacterized protein n=1 Tax=Yersinia phage fHe-Yen9-03 TaxID=2052743 RepID=A0A2C9CZE0_9CAUD|nr:hypothetical protein [Yersinia phage fHe-Yen9-03]